MIWLANLFQKRKTWTSFEWSFPLHCIPFQATSRWNCRECVYLLTSFTALCSGGIGLMCIRNQFKSTIPAHNHRFIHSAIVSYCKWRFCNKFLFPISINPKKPSICPIDAGNSLFNSWIIYFLCVRNALSCAL